MPELPDVETFRRYFEANALGRRITAARVAAPDMLHGISPRRLESRLTRRRFVRTRRHGKYLFAGLDDSGWLVLHFGMTGFLANYESPNEAPSHMRLRIDFAEGDHLAYDDQRKFGRMAFTEDVDAYVRERQLGPDPLASGFDLNVFLASIGHRRGSIKAAFMNQRVIAGVGNLYADEILFQAGVHPEAPVPKLDDRVLRNLYRTTRRVLRTAVRAGAQAEKLPRNYLLHRRGPHGRCPRCGHALARITVGMRTTYYCPHDQRSVRRDRKADSARS